LTERFFDSVPLTRIDEAERALRAAVTANIAPALRASLDAGEKLEDATRRDLLHIAREALAAFLSVVDTERRP